MIKRTYYGQNIVLIEAISKFECNRIIKACELKKYHLEQLKMFMKQVNLAFKDEINIKPFIIKRILDGSGIPYTQYILNDCFIIDINIDDIDIIYQKDGEKKW